MSGGAHWRVLLNSSESRQCYIAYIVYRVQKPFFASLVGLQLTVNDFVSKYDLNGQISFVIFLI